MTVNTFENQVLTCKKAAGPISLQTDPLFLGTGTPSDTYQVFIEKPGHRPIIIEHTIDPAGNMELPLSTFSDYLSANYTYRFVFMDQNRVLKNISDASTPAVEANCLYVEFTAWCAGDPEPTGQLVFLDLDNNC